MQGGSVRAAAAACLCVFLAALYCSNSVHNTRNLLHTNKLILSWVPFFGDHFYGFGPGQDAFIKAGCSVTTCEITADRNRVPLQQFDAILFHGFEYYEATFGVPSRRNPTQLYVFVSLEAAARASIPAYRQNFYNYTMTYRLDSDAPWTYFAVVDSQNKSVAPAEKPQWNKGTEDKKRWNKTLLLIAKKSRPIAWFVSNCQTPSKREDYAEELAQYIPVDVYGACGTFKCSKDSTKCSELVGQRYHFYLAMENSHCKDYITEKAAWAMEAGAVPIVRSGANLTGFFPPGSYIKADDSPKDLADRLLKILSNKTEYADLLRWRARYRVEQRFTIHQPPGEHPLCRLCAHLHDNEYRVRTKNVRQWWMGSKSAPTCR